MAAMALLLIATGCASTGEGRRASDTAVITEEEVAASVTTNAYDLIQSLRPRWLNVRGQQTLGTIQRDSAAGRAVSEMATTTIVVYVDGTRFGELGSLRNVSTRDIRSLRRLNASEATQRFGVGHTHGAIVITTR